MNRIIALFLIILSVSCNCPVRNRLQQDKDIQVTLDSLVSENEIPGLNVSIMLPDGKQRNYSAGMADIEKGLPMDPNHVLFSGSIGKTYAVAILMNLVDQGKLDLDDRFKDYFPEMDWLENIPNIDKITVRMLLQHTGGLPRYILNGAVWDSLQANPDKVWSYRERMSFIFNAEAVNEAGKGWSYSDTGYLLLGMLIEKITAEYYYDVVTSLILEPLELEHTYPAVRREIEGLPQGYSALPEFFRMPEKVVENGKYCINPQMEWTGGGFACRTPDLAKWARHYYNGNLFSDSLAEQIVTPLKFNIGENEAYGMGSFIFETSHGAAYGHSGFVPGFNSIFIWFPEQELAMAMQVNCDYAASKMSLVNYIELILNKI